jgi:hypothetical protein
MPRGHRTPHPVNTSISFDTFSNRRQRLTVDLAVRIRAGNGPAAVDRATVVAMIAAMDTMIAAMV